MIRRLPRSTLDRSSAASDVYKRQAQIAAGHEGTLGTDGAASARQELLDRLVGLGPLAAVVADPMVTDVLVNGDGAVWVDRGSGVERTARMVEPEDLRPLAVRLAGLAGRRLDDAQPWVDGVLPGGVRLHAVLPPLAEAGPHLSLRLARHHPEGVDALVRLGAVSHDLAVVLRQLVTRRVSLVVTGGTGLAPLRPLLDRFIAERAKFGAIRLFYGARTAADMLFTEELERWDRDGVFDITCRWLARHQAGTGGGVRSRTSPPGRGSRASATSKRPPSPSCSTDLPACCPSAAAPVGEPRLGSGCVVTRSSICTSSWTRPWLGSGGTNTARSCTTPACPPCICLLYTSDAADERYSVDLGGRRIIKNKKIYQQYRAATIKAHNH